MKRRRSPSSGMMAKAKLRPGRLKVLLGDMSVTVRAAASSETLAVGTCPSPSRSRSQWISSEHSTRSWRRQKSATASSSSRRHTRPSGLWGLQKTKTRVSGVSAASIASSGSRHGEVAPAGAAVAGAVSPDAGAARQLRSAR